MPALLNPRHELFAQELAKGTHQSFAYIAAFKTDSPKAAKASASRLLANATHGPAIRARVQELLAQRDERAQEASQQATEALAITRRWVLEGLVENANRCMAAVPVLSADGTPLGIYKHHAQGANRAYELIGKELGMFIDRSAIVADPDADLENMTPEQRAAEAQRLAAKLGLVAAEPEPPPTPAPRRKRGLGG